MTHFYSLSTKWKVLASLLWIATTMTSGDSSSSSSETSKYPKDAPAIANYLKEYIKPYIQSMNFESPTLRSAVQELGGKASMTTFIEDKLKSLMPYLDGGQPTEEPASGVRLDGEETTIVEFVDKSINNKGAVPRAVEDKNTFKDQIEEYKKLRKKINKALSKEPVSDKTKTLVTSTLDSMLAQLIGHQCKWTNGPKVQRADPGNVMDSWSRMWGTIKEQYEKLLSEQQNNEEKHQFLRSLHEFFSHMYEDVKFLSQNYKVVCQFIQPNQKGKVPFFGFGTNVEKADVSKPDVRTAVEKELQSNKMDDKNTCQNFRVCYTELKDFLIDLYTNLNDTGVSTISNYAAMYQRDVNEDSYHEKDNVIEMLNKIGATFELKIAKLFRKELTKFKLDPDKNRFANIKLINALISKNIESCKSRGKKLLEKHLKSLRPKLILNIVKDIVVNMDVDLGNLERDMNEKICTVFETCNSKYVASRRSGGFVNNKGVYVKVQLTLNEDNTRDQSGRRSFNNSTMKSETNARRYQVVTRPQKELTRTAPRIQNLILSDPSKFNEIKSNLDMLLKERVKAKKSLTTHLVIYKK